MVKKILLVSIFVFLFALCYVLAWGGTWHGKVVIQGTDQPIKDVVIVRSWVRESATPAGAVTSFLGMNEVVTDKQGEFTISAKMFFPGIPLITAVIEKRPVVYKPGYEFLALDKKKSVIELRKIPTILKLRKDELQKARDNYEIDLYNTHLFKDIVFKEEEFLEKRKYASEDRHRNFRNEVQQRIGYTGPGIKVMVNGKELNETHVKALINSLKNGGISQTRATNALINLGDRATNGLILSLKDSDWRVRDRAAYILTYANDSRVVDALIAASNDSNSNVVSSVVFALGEHRDPQSLNALVQALDNNDPEVRSMAADALRKIQDSRALDSLIKKMHDPSFRVRKSVVEAIGAMRDVRAIEALINSWHDEDQEVRGTAADILVEIGSSAVDSLIATTSHEDSYFRWRAARALGEIKDPKAVPKLISMLRDDVAEVKWTSIEALGFIKDHRAIESLTALLSNVDIGIKEKAIEVIQKIKK